MLILLFLSTATVCLKSDFWEFVRTNGHYFFLQELVAFHAFWQELSPYENSASDGFLLFQESYPHYNRYFDKKYRKTAFFKNEVVPQKAKHILCETHFARFFRRFKKNYQKREKQRRFNVFCGNLQKVADFNRQRGRRLFRMRANRFMDLTASELSVMGFNLETTLSVRRPRDLAERSVFVSSRVCNLFYAFAPLTLFTFLAQKTDSSFPTMEEWLGDSFRCSDGRIETPLSLLVTKGFPSGEVFLNNWSVLEPKQPLQVLVRLLCVAPVLTSFDFTGLASFGEGIYDGRFCNKRNRKKQWVLVTGFGGEQEIEFFVIKTWFGKDWGEDGNIKVKAGHGALDCGLGETIITMELK